MSRSSVVRWPVWADVVMVLVVTASSMRDAALASGQGLGEPSVVAGAVAGLSLAVRRRRPLAVTAVTVAAAGLWGLVLPLLVALFHLASRGRAWPAVTGAGVALLTNVLVHPALSLLATRSYEPALLLALAVALGLWAGSRRLVEALAGRRSSGCVSSGSCASRPRAPPNGPRAPRRCTTYSPTA